MFVEYLKKNKERIQKPKQTKDSGYIYQKELDKGCFQRDMVYRDFKEILSDKAFTMLKIQNMMDIKGVLLRWLIIFFKKKLTSGGGIKNENISNKELPGEFHKAIIRKCDKRKVQSSFIDKIWNIDLAHMQLIGKFNKQICFLLCVLIFSVNMHELFN